MVNVKCKGYQILHKHKIRLNNQPLTDFQNFFIRFIFNIIAFVFLRLKISVTTNDFIFILFQLATVFLRASPLCFF